jgi:hypothetical protein
MFKKIQKVQKEILNVAGHGQIAFFQLDGRQHGGMAYII